MRHTDLNKMKRTTLRDIWKGNKQAALEYEALQKNIPNFNPRNHFEFVEEKTSSVKTKAGVEIGIMAKSFKVKITKDIEFHDFVERTLQFDSIMNTAFKDKLGEAPPGAVAQAAAENARFNTRFIASNKTLASQQSFSRLAVQFDHVMQSDPSILLKETTFHLVIYWDRRNPL